MTAAKTTEATMLAVYDGSRCVGHLLKRSRTGVEAFDIDTRSIGIFPDMNAAADAVSSADARAVREVGAMGKQRS